MSFCISDRRGLLNVIVDVLTWDELSQPITTSLSVPISNPAPKPPITGSLFQPSDQGRQHEEVFKVEQEQGRPQGCLTMEDCQPSTSSTNIWSTHIHHLPVPSTRIERSNKDEIKDINGVLLEIRGGVIDQGEENCDSAEEMGNNISQLITSTIKSYPTAKQE